MILRFAKRMIASVLYSCALYGVAHAADPLPAESRLVSAPNAPTTAPAPLSFTIAAAEDLQVTLTDLQIPAALSSANIVVTQGAMIAGSATLAAPATTATFTIAGAVGNYTLSVFGVPGANFSVGTFTACVAPKANPSACIQSASLAGNITADSSAKDPTVSTLSTTLTVTTAGSYIFNFADLKFPVALNVAPDVALFQGSIMVQAPITSGTAINLSAGIYTLLAIAQADQTVKAGLYDITITGPAGTAPLLNSTEPVGLISPSSPFDNPSAQALTLKVTDFSFPGPLASASALLTAGGTALGQATAAGGAAMIADAPAGPLNVWTFGSPGATSGTYEVDVLAGATDLFTTAQGVSLAGSATYAFGFVTAPVKAGSYQANAADLQFPSTLTALGYAVAQNGLILKQSASAATLDVTTTAASAPVVFLVSAQAPAPGGMSGDGLFDVNLQTTGNSPQLLYDKTQSVSSTPGLLDSQTITLGVDANFTATLTDLKFPAAFDSLALVVSQAGVIAGKIFGGGTFNFPATAGNYQLTFVASPAAQQQFGLYGVSVVFAPPAITSFKPSASSVATGDTVTLTWATSNATSCTGSGGGWSVSSPGTSGSQSLVVSATTTYTLSCTGGGGKTSQSVMVTATAAPSSGGGGGAIDGGFLSTGAALVLGRMLRRFRRRP